MRFRSPTDTPIRVALTTGHVTIVGPEWRELPAIFHYDAVAAGCQREDAPPVPDAPKVEAGPAAMNRVEDYDTAYRDALAQLIARNGERDFTAAGLPNVNAVSKLCGFSARKEDVMHVFRAMQAEADAG